MSGVSRVRIYWRLDLCVQTAQVHPWSDPVRGGYLDQRALLPVRPVRGQDGSQSANFQTSRSEKLETYQDLHKYFPSGFENRNSIWYLSSIPDVKDFTFAITDPERRRLAEEIIQAFSDTVKPAESQLEKAIIHGDFNEQNILCREDPEGSGKYRWEIGKNSKMGDTFHY